VIRSRGRSLVSHWGVPILYLLLALAVATAVLQPIRSYDLWWHLATGRLILEQGRIPLEDPFSFTRSGFPWLDHGWLFQVLAWPLFHLGGWRLLLAAELLLISAVYLLLALVLRRERVGPGTACLLLLLSVSGARFRFDPRPELVSLFFVVLLCFALHLSRVPGPSRWVWVLPPLFLLWANIHPAAVLGAALLLLWLVGEWIQNLFKGQRYVENPRRGLVVLGSPLLILANPQGWRLLEVPLNIRRIVTSGHAPNLEWAAPTFRDFPLLFLAATAAVVLLLTAREFDLPPVLAAAAVGALAFLHLRNIGFFFVVLPLAMARPLATLAGKIRFPESPGRLLCAAALILISLLFYRGNRVTARGGYLAAVAPEKAVDFLEVHHIGQRLFNDVKFGGYLIWRRYPEHKVFIDGRNEVYDSLLVEVFKALGSWGTWEELLGRYGIDSALLRRGQMQAVIYPQSAQRQGPGRKEMRAFSASYFQASRWAQVYWDDQALILVRREDPAAATLLKNEYRLVNPDDIPHLELQVRRGEVAREEVLEELDRKLSEDPDCLTAQWLRALFVAQPERDPSR